MRLGVIYCLHLQHRRVREISNMKIEGNNESETTPTLQVTVCVWITLCIVLRKFDLLLHVETLKNYSVPVHKPTKDSAIFLNGSINLV
jgi:hypothetical protein